MKTIKHSLCVIIPCAGKGSRLGLPYPKELLTVEYGIALIDYCFALLRPMRHLMRIVIVINQNKLEIVKYLEKYKDEFSIMFIYQLAEENEMIGAIRSAHHFFLEHNLVLLPDTVIENQKSNETLIAETCSYLNHYPCVFWVKLDQNKNTLMSEGALSIQNKNGKLWVNDYQDKPMSPNSTLNGYWGSFAFNSKKAIETLDIMGKIIAKDSICDFKETFLHGSPAIEINDSIDLGIWSSIRTFMGARI